MIIAELLGHVTSYEWVTFVGVFLFGLCTGVGMSLLIGNRWFTRRP